MPGRGWTQMGGLWTWVARVADVADLDGCGRPLEPWRAGWPHVGRVGGGRQRHYPVPLPVL